MGRSATNRAPGWGHIIESMHGDPGYQPTATPAGWYPDPSGAPIQRYWDGTSWSVHVSSQQSPLGAKSPALQRRSWIPWLVAGVAVFVALCALLTLWAMRPSRQGQPGQPGQRAELHSMVAPIRDLDRFLPMPGTAIPIS